MTAHDSPAPACPRRAQPRHGESRGAAHKPAALEVLEGEGGHARGDAGDRGREIGVAERAVGERASDQHAPLVADRSERRRGGGGTARRTRPRATH